MLPCHDLFRALNNHAGPVSEIKHVHSVKSAPFPGQIMLGHSVLPLEALQTTPLWPIPVPLAEGSICGPVR